MSAVDESGWQPVAAFVVSFEQRVAGADTQRRLAVEQAEQSLPEPLREQWSGWPADAASAWMSARAAAQADVQADDQPAPVPETSDAPDAPPDPPPGPDVESSAERRRAPRARLCVDELVVVPAGSLDPVATYPESPLAAPPGSRLLVTVGATGGAAGEGEAADGGTPDGEAAEGEAGHAVHVALRLRRPGRPAATVDRTTLAPRQRGLLDLESLPDGEHRAVLAVWTDDGSAAPLLLPLSLVR